MRLPHSSLVYFPIIPGGMRRPPIGIDSVYDLSADGGRRGGLVVSLRLLCAACEVTESTSALFKL